MNWHWCIRRTKVKFIETITLSAFFGDVDVYREEEKVMLRYYDLMPKPIVEETVKCERLNRYERNLQMAKKMLADKLNAL